MRPVYWKLHRRGGKGGNAVVLGRKYCVGCGHWRHLCDFGRHRDAPRARCRVCAAAYNRQWYANATPEQRANMNEYYRFWTEKQRRDAGIPPRSFHHRRSVVDKREFVGLPPEPLLAEIDRSGLNAEELASMAGVPARSVFRFRSGESQHVRLDVADKIAVALNVPLTLIYGDTPAKSFHANGSTANRETKQSH